ncbi:immunity 49 family protein [Streptomyces gobitricini]|uniref:Uncharacterized protein n=1 Tax=Streptomyces gobitricini TaxID=68211 RepID=A0ABP5YY27_9ACTN
MAWSPTELIESTFSTSLLVLNARCVVDPRAAEAETWDAAVNAMQLGSALFAVTGASEGTVECRINRKMRTLQAIGPQLFADTGNWLTAFLLAVVCREQQRMTQLCEIPLERLRSPEGQYDEYVYHWIDTLQTYWLRRPGLVEKLTATLQASDPSVARIAPRDMPQGLLCPPINLFYHFVRRDEEGFSPALVEALKLHKAVLDADRGPGERHRREHRPGPAGDRLPGLRREAADRRRVGVPAQARPPARLAGRVPDLRALVTVTVARHGGPGSDDKGYAESRGRDLLRTVASLEESPGRLDGPWMVHSGSGPGFNVYACTDCAPQLPDLPDALDLLRTGRQHGAQADLPRGPGNDSVV